MKIFFMLCLLWTVVSTQAQNKQEQMKQIRQAYSEAKQQMTDNNKKGAQRMDVKISVNDGTVVSEDFVINDERKLDFYFKRIHQSGQTDLFEPCCYFIVESTAANGHTSYREMLFNPLSGHLLFSFMKAETHAGFVIETRYYYDETGNVIERKCKMNGNETEPDNQSWSDAGSDQKTAMIYTQIFLDLMRQKGQAASSYTASQSAGKDALMKRIRTLYTQAKQDVQKDAKSETPMNVRIEINDKEDPAMPAQKDIIQYWFRHNGDEGKGRCYFASSTCNLGDHSVYSEYLFDPQDSHLLFCYSQQKHNDGTPSEWRYYFDKAEKCIEVKGQEPKYGPGFADKTAAKAHLELFNVLINPSF